MESQKNIFSLHLCEKFVPISIIDEVKYLEKSKKTNTPFWSTDVRRIRTVHHMIRSRFFWLPLLSVILLCFLFSDIFLGFQDISFSRNFYDIDISVAFDVNIVKIITALTLSFIFLGMLQGMGRRVAGWGVLLLALFYNATGVVSFNVNTTHAQLPLTIFYGIFFLATWFALTFHSRIKGIPSRKIVKAYIGATFFLVGLWFLNVFIDSLNIQGISVFELFADNEFSIVYSIGLVFIFLPLSFAWKDICDGKGLSSKLSCEILYITLFLVPTLLTLYIVWEYLLFVMSNNQLPQFSLEWISFFACVWAHLLFRSMHKYRMEKHLKGEEQPILKILHSKTEKNLVPIQAMILLALSVIFIMFSSVFYGIEGVPITIDSEFMSIETSFNLNFFKIIFGIVLIFLMHKLLPEHLRRICGVICFFAIFISPMSHTLAVTHSDGIHYEFPMKMIYSLFFMICWCVLSCYGQLKGSIWEKIVKTTIFSTVFFTGVFSLNLYFSYINYMSMSFVESIAIEGANGILIFGFAFILIAISFLWKDISNGKDIAVPVHNILFVCSFLLPVVMSLFSIIGYINLILQVSTPLITQFSINWLVFGASVWIYILFRIMYNYRKENLNNGDFIHKLLNKIPEDKLIKIITIPMWFLVLTLPIVVMNVFNIFIVT